MDARVALVRLTVTPGVGPVTAARLLEAYESDPAAIFAAPRSILRQIPKVGPKLADALHDERWADEAAREIARAEDHEIGLVTRFDAAYPPGLREIPDAPPLLYVRGDLRGEAEALAVAIVGSRQTSYYGRDQARRFGRELAARGLTVASGFARGIDTAAHRGATETPGGRTIAVIGSGLLDIYPPENADLVGLVAEHGAIVSEFPLRTPPNASNFPRRNRILAGMSLGTLVIEAGVQSGAMITARLASEYNREVLAIPGRIDDERTRGCHRLIKDGASLVESVDDVLDALGAVGDALRADEAAEAGTKHQAGEATELGADPAGRSARNDRGAAVDRPAPQDPVGAKVWAALTAEPRGLEALASDLDLPVHQVLAALTMLELSGHVRSLAGRHYTRR